MKPPEVRKYLFDAAEACDLITEFVAGKTFADYREDQMMRSAVERQFENAGEALARLLRIAPELETRVSDIRRIIAFRSRLMHGYASVLDDLVWGIVETNVSVLKTELVALIAED